MTARGEPGGAAFLPLLLRLDVARLRGSVRRPRAGPWLGAVLPLALLAPGLWAAGRHLRPRVEVADDAVLLGLLVSGAVAWLAYPVLFRPADDALLRRLGVPAAALFAERALRLAALALGLVLALLLPLAAHGAPLALPLAVGVGAAGAAWGSGLLALSGAARSVGAGGRPGLASRMMGPDPGLVSAAPLVYAPLVPLLAGAAAAGVVGAAPEGAALRLLAVLAPSLALAVLAARPFVRALPRFAAKAGEMAFEPPPPAGEAELVLRRGLYRLLPPRAAAVRARDAVVVGRRFRWTERVVWPVAAASVVALLRWGDAPGVRAWVLAAGVGVLLAQGGALVALGRSERERTRWLDRAAGVGTGARLLGRWAVGAGWAAWLALPLALAWGARSPAGVGWGWLAAALAVSGVAAALSLAAAGR